MSVQHFVLEKEKSKKHYKNMRRYRIAWLRACLFAKSNVMQKGMLMTMRFGEQRCSVRGVTPFTVSCCTADSSTISKMGRIIFYEATYYCDPKAKLLCRTQLIIPSERTVASV